MSMQKKQKIVKNITKSENAVKEAPQQTKGSIEQHGFKITFTEKRKYKPATRTVTVTSKDFNSAMKVFYQEFGDVVVDTIEALGK